MSIHWSPSLCWGAKWGAVLSDYDVSYIVNLFFYIESRLPPQQGETSEARVPKLHFSPLGQISGKNPESDDKY